MKANATCILKLHILECSWLWLRVDLTLRIVLAICAICEVEKEELRILMERLSQNKCLLHILSHALPLKFSLGATLLGTERLR